jgi:hypothetical protein
LINFIGTNQNKLDKIKREIEYVFEKTETIKFYENQTKKLISLENMIRLSNEVEIIKTFVFDKDQLYLINIISQLMILRKVDDKIIESEKLISAFENLQTRKNKNDKILLKLFE